MNMFLSEECEECEECTWLTRDTAETVAHIGIQSLKSCILSPKPRMIVASMYHETFDFLSI